MMRTSMSIITMTTRMRSTSTIIMMMRTACAAAAIIITTITATTRTKVFVSWGTETVRKFGEDELSAMLSQLDGGEYGLVLRAKGIVPCTDGGWIHFDYTPGEQNIRKGPADYTGRLCVIGSKLVDEKLAKLFGVA